MIPRLALPAGFYYSVYSQMGTPCRKCGAEKTENVHHGLMYSLAKALGYRLRICSRCHRFRLFPRHGERAVTTQEPRPVSKTQEKGACPKCGKSDYRRSRRHLWERLLFRRRMVRCRACKTRFPMPRPEDLGVDG